MLNTEAEEPIYIEPIKVREEDTPEAILKEARERAEEAFRDWKDDFTESREDVAFAGGSQWTEEERGDRDDAGKITLTINRLPQYINRVVGSQRKTVQSIQVSPRTSALSSKEKKLELGNGEEVKVSQVIADFIRDIEYSSNARQSYKMAFKHAVDGGFGWLRVITAYERGGFNQEIQIKGIRDRYSVYLDKSAKEADYSDANYGFIVEQIPDKEFKLRYPDAITGGLGLNEGSTSSTFWKQENTTSVAEYFRREPFKKTIALLSNGEVVDYEEAKGLGTELEQMGVTVEKTRVVDSYKVIWTKITGNSVLEPDREFLTETIPIVPVLGREIDLDDDRRYKSLIFDAKDPQRMLNATRSSALERVNLISKTPFIAEDKAIAGKEKMWAEANTKNFGVLTYNTGRPIPQRQPMATAPVGEMQMGEVLNYDIQAGIGMYGSSLGEQTNEISGKAIRARQSEADEGTFEFVDNLNVAIRRIGLLCVELIPKIYDTNRIIQLRSMDGKVNSLEINKEVEDEDGKPRIENTLDDSRYDVVIQSGASYATRQEEASNQILELMKINPQIAQIAPDLLVSNLDFADSEVIAERAKKTIPMNLLSKEEQEEIQKDMPEPQPSPEQQKAQLEMQKLQMELEAKAKEKEIDLQIAMINLETKKYEAQIKGIAVENNLVNAEEKRKNDIAKGIADKIRASKEVAK
jgi:hypothetical protein